MEKQIAEKVKRYLELSVKFSKSENELFPEQLHRYKTIVINDGCSASYIGVSSEEKIPTRTELIKQELENKVKLSEDFEEYEELQKILLKYFNSLTELTKE